MAKKGRLGAARESRQAMEEKKLVNSFLVASPRMLDPRFSRTVIFIALHDKEHGAIGVVVNRPSNVRLGELFKQLKMPSDARVSGDFLGWGGPVQPSNGFIVHTPDREALISIFKGESITVTVSPDILEMMSRNDGPRGSYVVLGCSGWDSGQLEREIEEGSWLIAPADPRVVFETPVEERYEAALALVGLTQDNLNQMNQAFSSGEAGHA